MKVIDERLDIWRERLKERDIEPVIIIGIKPDGEPYVCSAQGEPPELLSRLCRAAADRLGRPDPSEKGPAVPGCPASSRELASWIGRQPEAGRLFDLIRSIGVERGYPWIVQKWSPFQVRAVWDELHIRRRRGSSPWGAAVAADTPAAPEYPD